MVFEPRIKEMIWEKYPDFARRRVFKTLPKDFDPPPKGYEEFKLQDLDKMIKFAILFLDPLSEFADERDFDLRKKLCMESLGFETDERFYQEVEDDTEYWHKIMFEYFKMSNELEYELWFSSWYGIKIQYAKLRSNMQMKETDRVKVMSSLQEQTYELIKLQNQLFPNERTKQIVARRATEDGIAGFAEKFALNLDLQ